MWPGQVCRTTDGNGNSVQYRYNSFGKVSERIDQLGYSETFRYDEEGNLSLHIDRDGRQLQRDCNVFGKPVYEKATDAEGKILISAHGTTTAWAGLLVPSVTGIPMNMSMTYKAT